MMTSNHLPDIPASRTPKYEQLASAIERAIYEERLAEGDALPSEGELAQIYGVSRGTVRRALADLAQKKIIVTKNGIGSHVTFRNHTFDESQGWGIGLIQTGINVCTEILRIEHITDPELANQLGIDHPHFIAIDRCRRLPTGTAISLEYSRVDATHFSHVLEDGLAHNSLTETIKQAGLEPAYGKETIRVAALSNAQAEIFERRAGTRFMISEKCTFTSDGALVEYVKSYLDPDHFEYVSKF